MQAIDAVRKISPAYALSFENRLFTLARLYCKSYAGGLWTSKLIEPGFWLALPPIKGKFEFVNPDNYYSGEVNALIAGAAITCIALNQTLAFAYGREGDSPTVAALSELWSDVTEACNALEVEGFDRAAFFRIID